MDYTSININTGGIDQPHSRSTDPLLSTNPPGPSCLSRLARNDVGQRLASNFTKGASGLTTMVGGIMLAVGTYEKDISDVGAIVGAGVIGMGFSAWVTSTALSASIRPEGETACSHIGKSAAAYLLGFCICCSMFCQ